jgi:hypothetical protein
MRNLPAAAAAAGTSADTPATQRRAPMFASIRRHRTSDPEEARRRVEVGFLPLLRVQPGFVSYSLVHAGNGVMVSITVFTTREGAEHSNRMAAEWIAEHTALLLQGRPDITQGEVVVHAP